MTHPGPAIRAMRQASGLGLRDLASMSDTSPGYLSRVERGEATPTDRWLKAVTSALGRHLAGEAA